MSKKTHHFRELGMVTIMLISTLSLLINSLTNLV
jgi:hypothetical protein